MLSSLNVKELFYLISLFRLVRRCAQMKRKALSVDRSGLIIHIVFIKSLHTWFDNHNLIKKTSSKHFFVIISCYEAPPEPPRMLVPEVKEVLKNLDEISDILILTLNKSDTQHRSKKSLYIHQMSRSKNTFVYIASVLFIILCVLYASMITYQSEQERKKVTMQ